MATPEPRAALVDATKPGAHLPEPVAKYYAGEAWAEHRKVAKRSKSPAPAPNYVTDPDTTYAAVVVAVGKRTMVASGGLVAPIDPPDETRLLAWKGAHGERVTPGDVVPVYFRALPLAGRPGRDERRAVLATPPTIQGALVALDPSNGHLISMVGGYD